MKSAPERHVKAMVHRNRRTTRIVRSLAAAAAAFVISASAAHAAPAMQATTIEFDPQNGVIVGAAVLEVDVRVENVTDLNAFDIYVTFDPGIVQVVDFVPGPGIQMELGDVFCPSVFTLFNTADNSLGTLHVASAQLACPGFNGSGVLFTIRFEGVVDGISDLVIGEDPIFPLLADPNGVEIPSTPIDGTVEVTDLMAIELEGFGGRRVARGVQLAWRTLSETDNVGFHVLRQEGDDPPTQITPSLIPSRAVGGELGGAEYAFVDATAPIGALRYWLVDVDVKGRRTRHGPIDVAPAYHWVPVDGAPGLPNPGLPIAPPRSSSPR